MTKTPAFKFTKVAYGGGDFISYEVRANGVRGVRPAVPAEAEPGAVDFAEQANTGTGYPTRWEAATYLARAYARRLENLS